MVQQGIFQEQRVAVLVDVQNMYYSAKNLYNSKVRFDEILRDCVRGRVLVRAIAYAIKADVKDESNFHEALEKIGYEVKLKDLLVFYGGHKKGDWDIGIAMDAVRAAEKVDVLVVVSGDGDFRELYEYIRGKGCRIEVMAFGRTASSSIKEYVDLFIDMDKNKKYLIPLKHQQGHSHHTTNSGQPLNPNGVQNTQETFNVKQTIKPIEANITGQELSIKTSSISASETGEFDILKVNQDQPTIDQQGSSDSSNAGLKIRAHSNLEGRKHQSGERRRFNQRNQGNQYRDSRYKQQRSRPSVQLVSDTAEKKNIDIKQQEAVSTSSGSEKIDIKSSQQKEQKPEGIFNKLIKRIKK